MKMNVKWLVVAAIMASLVAGAAHASEKIFNRLDADKSATISRDELVKSDLVVVTGKDGKQQVQHRDLVRDGQAAALTSEQKHRLFDHIDRDKDGFINRKEWNRASPDGFILWKF